MDCEGFQGLLDRWVDGELSAAEADEMRGHARGCESCARAEVGLRHLRSSLKRAVNRHRPPAGLEGEVLRSLRAGGRERVERAPKPSDENRRVGNRFWRANVVVPAPFVALLLLLPVLLVGWLLFTRGPARGVVSTKPLAASPTSEGASGGFDFSRYYGSGRASIKVVRRASLDGSR
jgi:anti-sigma factor RsiW